MYTGIKLDVSVNDYASARAALTDRCAKSRGHRDDAYPGGGWVPLGHKRSQVTTIRMARDESIVCRLYNTDVVTWHPDNSVSVIAFPTKTTGAFASALLPAGLNLGGESELMTFFPGCDEDSDWRTRWGNAHICNGTGTFREVNGAWVPDESTVGTLTKVLLDKTLTRQLSREYHFAEFQRWLFTASHHMTIQHEGVDYEGCAEAMRERNYRKAATMLPSVEVPRGFGTRWDEPITLSSVDYVRRWVYNREGALEKHEVTTMSLPEYDQQRRLQNQLSRSGVYL